MYRYAVAWPFSFFIFFGGLQEVKTSIERGGRINVHLCSRKSLLAQTCNLLAALLVGCHMRPLP